MRPKRYRRAGPWLALLPRLHADGLADADLARELTRSDPAAAPWTRRQAAYHRAALGLPANGDLADCGGLAGLRLDRARSVAASLGWGHLLGRSAELAGLAELDAADAAARLPGWTAALVAAWRRRPWDVLWPAESRALTGLADHGPSGRRELARRLGLGEAHTWRTGPRSVLAVLVGRALAVRTRHGPRGPCLYALAPGVARHTPSPFARLVGPRPLRELGLRA